MNNYPCRAIRTKQFKLIWNLRADLTCTSHLTNARGKDRRDLWRLWDVERASNPQIDRAMDQYQQRPEFELYDLQTDPDELKNLANRNDHADTLHQLQAQLEAWMTAQRDQRRDMASFLNAQ
ncbi:DUF4976 domain-containing protein [Pirellulales bacterium]|nr:DUF4976 domain-containing protein [Pirellulales bacterium]